MRELRASRRTATPAIPLPLRDIKHQNQIILRNETKPRIQAKQFAPEYSSLQTKVCQSYKELKGVIEQCQSCIERQVAAGGCRFVGLRAFKVVESTKATQDEGTETKNEVCSESDISSLPMGPSNTKKRKLNGDAKSRNKELQTSQGDVLYDDYCIVGNRVPKTVHQEQHIKIDRIGILLETQTILDSIAPSFERVLRREERHEDHSHHKDLYEERDLNNIRHPIVRIRDEPLQRSLCDMCATSVFLISYLCVVCGKEICPDCYDEWDTSEGSKCSPIAKCSRRRQHEKSHLVILARADEGEIKSLLQQVAAWRQNIASQSETLLKDFPTTQIQEEKFGSLSVYKTSTTLLSEAEFQQIWRLSNPLVLTGFLPRFHQAWSPTAFIKEYGSSPCTIHDCTPPYAYHSSTVKAFFSAFDEPPKDAEHQAKSLKLKDWPPADDFGVVFPKLFADFESALPWAGKFMARNGQANLASYFPNDWNKPDLGPKMYNATPAPGEGLGVEPNEHLHGTTNLHLDITDAINIMVYAAGEPETKPTKDGTHIPCAAIWDIFPPSASSKIREYLKRNNEKLDDPIHRQTYYLSDLDLQELEKEPFSIRSYRIYQNRKSSLLT